MFQSPPFSATDGLLRNPQLRGQLALGCVVPEKLTEKPLLWQSELTQRLAQIEIQPAFTGASVRGGCHQSAGAGCLASAMAAVGPFLPIAGPSRSDGAPINER